MEVQPETVKNWLRDGGKYSKDFEKYTGKNGRACIRRLEKYDNE